MNLRSTFLASLTLVSAKCFSDEPKTYLLSFTGQSWRILGSEDFRRVSGIGLAFSREEPRFKFRGLTGDLVWEGFLVNSTSDGTGQFKADHILGLGVIALARHRLGRFYSEFGLGLEYLNQLSYDISSKLSSTPTAGFGYAVPIGKVSELLIGLRLHHVSNAGTQPHNKGQNETLLVLSYRY